MSSTNYERIRSANGDPYQILNVDQYVTPEQAKAAYKSLALEFHPDRIKLPDAKPGSFEETLVLDYKAKASETFKAISDAFHILSDCFLVAKRKEDYDQRAGSRALAVAPYSSRDSLRPLSRASTSVTSPTSLNPSSYGSSAFGSSPSSATSYSTSPASHLQRSRSSSKLAHSSHGPIPQRSNSAASEREMHGGGYDAYSRSVPVDPYDRLQAMGSKAPIKKPDPFAIFDDMFGGQSNDLFGGFGMQQGQGRPRHSSMSAGGNAADPFDALANMFGNFGGGPPPQSGHGGDMFGMSPESAGDDPFQKMFAGLNMNGDSGMKGRGGFATYKQTKRHKDRHGNYTATMQSRSIGVIDAGDGGQVVVENSTKISGFRPASSNRIQDMSSNGYPQRYSSYSEPQHYDAPHMSPYQALPPAPRRMSMQSIQGASPQNPYLPSMAPPSSRISGPGTPLAIESAPYSPSVYSTSPAMLTNGPADYGRRQIGW